MTAVLATFVDIKTIKTRGVLQIVLETPIENADAALKALGGVPQPATERWVGVALAPKERVGEASKAKRLWADTDPTTQAALRCNDQEFRSFLETQFDASVQSNNVAAYVHEACKVVSRSEFNTDPKAAARWKALEAQYQQYLTDRRYEGSRTR